MTHGSHGRGGAPWLGRRRCDQVREWSHDGRCDTGKDFGNILWMSHDYDQHLRGGGLHVSLLRYNIDEDTRPFVAYSDPMGCSIVLVTRPVVQSPLDSTPKKPPIHSISDRINHGHNRDHRPTNIARRRLVGRAHQTPLICRAAIRRVPHNAHTSPARARVAGDQGGRARSIKEGTSSGKE